MRKMATIRRIDSVEPIPGADRICVYVIDGWKIVDGVGLYKPGDLVIMCEIDSWIPNSIAPFLTKPDRFPKEYLGVPGEKLKTVKLKGQISQGLILLEIYSNPEHYLVVECFVIVSWPYQQF